MEQPRSFVALYWDEVNKLEKQAKKILNDTGKTDQYVRAQTILEMIEWIRKHNIYTRY
jgi:hypothetical protein